MTNFYNTKLDDTFVQYFRQKSNFRSKIELSTKNRNFGQKSNFRSKIELSIKKENTNFDQISSNVGVDSENYDIFDKISDLSFEEGALYAYHHIGNENCKSFVNGLSGNIIFDNFERYFDKFDKIFSKFFEGALEIGGELLKSIPEEWIRDALQKQLTEEEKEKIDSLGGWDKLLETLKERLEEQNKRHQGGNKWIAQQYYHL